MAYSAGQFFLAYASNEEVVREEYLASRSM